jgi:phage gp29-like protein
MATTSKKPAPSAPTLDTEVANRLRDPFETNYLGVLRTNDPLLLERSNGGAQAFELYRDLKRDGKVYSGLQKRKLALISRPWQVDPIEDGEAGQRDADVVQAMLKSVMFDKLCSELLDALLVGFVPAEIVWTVRNGLITPGRIKKRAQRRFVYVQTDPNAEPELHLLTAANMLTGEVIEDKKFIVHRFNPEDDNPYGMGLGLQLYWPVFFKRKGILSWNKLNDRFGSPTPWGKYPKGAGEKEKGTLFDALKAMSNDGVIMTPDGMLIEMLESKLTGSVSTQEQLCKYMDGWISEVILSQEATQQTGATGAASNEREDVRLDLVQADADLLSDTLNSTLIAWFCELNGLCPCQVSRVVKKSEDLKAASETDKNVASMGFKLSLDAVREKYGEGWEEAPAPPAAPAQDSAPSAPGVIPAKAGIQAPAFAEPSAATPGPSDAQAALLAQAGDEVLGHWMAQIKALVDTAESTTALRDALLQAYGDLPTEQLTEVMALAFAAAHLKGMDAVVRETSALQATPAFAEAPPPDPRIDQISASVATLQSSVDLLQAKQPFVIHNNIALPDQPAPVVNNTVNLPEQAAPVVNLSSPAITVQPAPVTVNNAFAAKAVQTVQRDANDEIVSTTTLYQSNQE